MQCPPPSVLFWQARIEALRQEHEEAQQKEAQYAKDAEAETRELVTREVEARLRAKLDAGHKGKSRARRKREAVDTALEREMTKAQPDIDRRLADSAGAWVCACLAVFATLLPNPPLPPLADSRGLCHCFAARIEVLHRVNQSKRKAHMRQVRYNSREVYHAAVWSAKSDYDDHLALLNAKADEVALRESFAAMYSALAQEQAAELGLPVDASVDPEVDLDRVGDIVLAVRVPDGRLHELLRVFHTVAVCRCWRTATTKKPVTWRRGRKSTAPVSCRR